MDIKHMSKQLRQTLKRYNWLYSHYIPQKALYHQSPISVMKEWEIKRPSYLISG